MSHNEHSTIAASLSAAEKVCGARTPYVTYKQASGSYSPPTPLPLPLRCVALLLHIVGAVWREFVGYLQAIKAGGVTGVILFIAVVALNIVLGLIARAASLVGCTFPSSLQELQSLQQNATANAGVPSPPPPYNRNNTHSSAHNSPHTHANTSATAPPTPIRSRLLAALKGSPVAGSVSPSSVSSFVANWWDSETDASRTYDDDTESSESGLDDSLSYY